MAWESSDRRLRLPADWKARRQKILSRCGHRCEALDQGVRCVARATDVDHVRPGDDHSLTNLQGLCADHHKAKTAREAADRRRAIAAARYRPREVHPAYRR